MAFKGKKIRELSLEKGLDNILKHLNKDEIQEAFDDYNKTNFGGWNWKNSAPVHGYKKERFAKFIDGSVERPS